jgi:hypothetical protein
MAGQHDAVAGWLRREHAHVGRPTLHAAQDTMYALSPEKTITFVILRVGYYTRNG